MSIVCCKVEKECIEIASDSIMVRYWTQSKGNNDHSKLVKVNNMILGSSGTVEESGLMQMYCQTRKPEKPKQNDMIRFMTEFAEWKNKRTENFNVKNSYIFSFEGHAFYVHGFEAYEILTYDAIGAGMEYALSALYLGHNVEKAVEVACELSVFCEKPIIKFQMKRQ